MLHKLNIIVLLGNQRTESWHTLLEVNHGTYLGSQTSGLPCTFIVDGHNLLTSTVVCVNSEGSTRCEVVPQIRSENTAT